MKLDEIGEFGFIEHFKNWEVVLEKQASLVKSGGLLVVSTPNFRGFVQRLFHCFFDKKNYDLHNIISMDPKRWAEIVHSSGFDIIFAGYFGRFHFWTDYRDDNLLTKIAAKILRLIVKASIAIGYILPQGIGFYAPHCGLVARKL